MNMDTLLGSFLIAFALFVILLVIAVLLSCSWLKIIFWIGFILLKKYNVIKISYWWMLLGFLLP
jgi:hypothetical protein